MIKKELRLGISKLHEETYNHLFLITDIYTEEYTIEQQLEWFTTIRKAREDSDDPKMIIDVFSVDRPLRKWAGLQN